MKRLAIVTAGILLSGSLMAQTDSTSNTQESDTVKVGNFIIIKKIKMVIAVIATVFGKIGIAILISESNAETEPKKISAQTGGSWTWVSPISVIKPTILLHRQEVISEPYAQLMDR